MNQPTDILFQVVSNLTGGLINDLTTALLAIIAITFICMGFDYLKDVFETRIHTRNVDRSLNDAREYRKVMDNSMVDPTIRDMYRAKYKAAIRRASE